MKRLFLLFSAFALVTALSACDLFSPEVVEEISEEYCRDNPDSEICQGESVGDLQDDAILNVFNTILSEYNDTSQTTFCEDYFSVTNTELLDACRASREGLFPEDVSGFTIEDVSRVASLSTVDRFEITVLSPDKQTRYVFEIGLVMVDGIMYINSWDYETETIDPTTLTVSFADAEAYLEQFLADYTNDNITSATICQTYLADDDGCVADRDGSLADDFTATLSNLTESAGTYTATIQTSSTSDGASTMTLTMTFAYDSNGDIVMTFLDGGNEEPQEYTFDDYEAFVEELFQAFFHSTRTPEDVCDSYFIPGNYDMCMEGHTMKETEGYTQSIADFVPYEDHYLMTVNHLEGTTVTEQYLIEVWFYETDDGLRVEFVLQEDPNDEYDIFWNLLNDFVEAYNNTSLADDAAIDPFFDETTAAEVKEDRQDNLAEGIRLVVVDLYQDDTDHWFFVLNIAGGDPTGEETYPVEFFLFEGAWRMSLVGTAPVDEYDLYLQHLEAFFQDYNDPAISNDDAVNPYIDPMQADDLKEERQSMLSEGHTIELAELYYDVIDGWYMTIVMHDDTGSNQQDVYLEFFYDENEQLKVTILMDDNPSDYDLLYDHLQAFFDAYNNPALTDDQAVDPFFDPTQAADIKFGRQDALSAGHTVELLALYMNEDGIWMFDMIAHEDTGDMETTVRVEFYYDENDQLKMRFLMGPDPDDYPIYLDHLEAFMAAFNDPSLSHEQAIDPFIDPMQAEELRQRRDELVLGAGGFVELLQFYFDPAGNWWMEVRIVAQGEEDFETLPIGFYYDESDTLRMWIDFSGSGNDEFADQRSLIEGFLINYQNPSVTDAMLCEWFFLDPTSPACYDLRSYFVPDIEAYLIGLYSPDHIRFDVQIELYHESFGYKSFHWNVEFGHDSNDGSLKMIVFDSAPVINWDDAQAFLDDFVFTFNDGNVPDGEFADRFALDASHDLLLQLRMDYLGQRIVHYWLNEEYGKYWMAVEFDNGDVLRWDLRFQYMDDAWYAEFVLHVPDEKFTYDDVWQLADDIAWEYNAGMTHDSLCSMFFGQGNMDRCRMEFDAFGMLGGELSVSNVWSDNHAWLVEYRLTNDDGSETFVTWSVIPFEDEFGTLRFDFSDHTLIPEAQMLQHLQNFIVDFNGFDYDAATVCGMYLAPESQAGCIELYNELSVTGQQLNLYTYELKFPPFWIELLIYDPAETLPAFYLQGEVQFHIDENGVMWMNFYPGDRYTLVTEANAEGILMDLLASLNDINTSDEDFCNDWGHLFADCYGLRNQIRNGSTVVLHDWYFVNSTEISLQAQRIENGAAVEDLYFHLTLRRALDGSLMIHGWQEIYNAPYTLADVEAAYEELLNAYFDPAFSDEDIEMMFMEGFYFPGIEFRSDLLAMGYTVSLVGIESISFDYGFEVFEAEVLVTKDGVSTTYYLSFNPWIDENGTLMVMPMYDWKLPEDAVLNGILAAMIADFNDSSLSNATFCATYFDQWSADWCTDLRQQMMEQNLTAQLGFIDRYDDHASFDIEFYDTNNVMVQTLQFGYYHLFNFLEEPQPSMYLEGDTIAWDYAYDFLLDIASRLEDGTLSIADFCATYDCGGMFSDNGQAISIADLMWLDLNWESFFSHTLRGELYLEYNDGSYVYLRMLVPFTIDENGVYHYDLQVIGIELPLPDDAVMLDQAATELVLDDFVADVVDATIDAQTLCGLYFGGSMMSPDCLEERSQWLSEGTLITRSPVTAVTDEYGFTYYTLTFTFITNGTSESMDTALVVFRLSDGTHVLMFDDIDPDTVE